MDRIDLLDWADQPKGNAGEVKMPKPDSMAQLDKDGWAVFSVAPIVNYVPKVTAQDLFMAYAGEPNKNKPPEIRTARFEISYPVVAHCGLLGIVLHAMDKANYAWLKQWMLSQNFLDSYNGNYYVARLCACPVMDPFIRMKGKGHDQGVSLDVFAVASMRGTMVPKHMKLSTRCVAPLYVMFECGAADPDVVKVGRALLEERKPR